MNDSHLTMSVNFYYLSIDFFFKLLTILLINCRRIRKLRNFSLHGLAVNFSNKKKNLISKRQSLTLLIEIVLSVKVTELGNDIDKNVLED